VELATRVGDDMTMFFRETPGWGSGGCGALEAGRDDAEGRIARGLWEECLACTVLSRRHNGGEACNQQ
jgi:hypothetical protein